MQILVMTAFLFSVCSTNAAEVLDEYENLEKELLDGDKALRYQFPYHISLQQNIGGKFWHICSGAILGAEWAVTTAYCCSSSPPDTLSIVAGQLVQRETHPDIQTANVEEVVPHPNYTGGISSNDIALLKLATSLFFTKSVRPILFAMEDSEDVWGAAILSSWKVHKRESKHIPVDSLYYTIMHISTKYDCANQLKATNVTSASVICSEEPEESSYCAGESGAPLVYNGHLVGITSWSFSLCGTTVYTNVTAFVDFIIGHVGSNVV